MQSTTGLPSSQSTGVAKLSVKRQPSNRRPKGNNKNKNQNRSKGQGPELKIRAPYGKEVLATGARGISRSYLKTLVDPERNKNVRYPDELPKMTGVFQGLLNKQLTPFVAADNLEPAGTFLNVVSPTLVNPLLEFKRVIMDDNNANIIVSEQTDDCGLFPLEEDNPTHAIASRTMSITAGETHNIRGFTQWAGDDFAVPPFEGKRDDNTTFYGTPVVVSNTGGGSVNITVQCNKNADATVTAPFQIRCVTTTSATAWIDVPFAVGASKATISVAGSVLDPLLPNTRYAKMPGLGWQIRLNPTTATTNIDWRCVLINSIEIQYNTQQNTQARLVPSPLEDTDTYCETIDQYRVVSMSAWLQYQGSDLKNGGQLSTIMYRGGQSAFENGLWNYNKVAVTPGGYQGALKNGSYSIWLPSNENDMLMRSLNSSTRWTHPYIVNVGYVSEPDQLDSLRLRVPFNFEFVSTAQFYAYAYPNPDPLAIALATRALRDYPTSMENTFHWDTISKILDEVGDRANKIAEFGQRNAAWIAPLIGGFMGRRV